MRFFAPYRPPSADGTALRMTMDIVTVDHSRYIYSMQLKFYSVAIGLFLLGLCAHASSRRPKVPCETYASPVQALEKILDEAAPRIIGFGEYHQQEETVDVPSAIKRFTDSLLPVLTDKTSDLLLETWIPEGDCGEAEEAVVADVEETINRPESTEDEIVTLIKTAWAFGVQPHIMKMTCEDYMKLQGSDTGEVDYNGLMNMIARQMEEKCMQLLEARRDEDPARTLLVIYGGALHNDMVPDDEWRDASFGPKIDTVTQGRYVEVDLYVPEFIEGDEYMQQEAWFPVFRKNASPDRVLLIKPGPNRYILVLRRQKKR
jgi:hypothetical protein